MGILDRLMLGSIDMHVHYSPDSLQERRQDALQLAESARDTGMRAIVLKSREYMTVPIAQLVSQLVPQVAVFGSITLDNEVGGLNPAVVLAAAHMGAKVIWMPTFSAANSKTKAEAALGFEIAGSSLSILGDDGKLRPEVKEMIQIVRDFNIILASGHLSPREVFIMVEAGKAAGLTKMVATHVLQPQLMVQTLTNDEIENLAQKGVFIEYSFWTCRNHISNQDPRRLAESIKAVGAEHCIMTTDFGQVYNAPAPEGMRLFIQTMLQNGLSEKEIEIMVRENLARLLGLS